MITPLTGNNHPSFHFLIAVGMWQPTHDLSLYAQSPDINNSPRLSEALVTQRSCIIVLQIARRHCSIKRGVTVQIRSVWRADHCGDVFLYKLQNETVTPFRLCNFHIDGDAEYQCKTPTLKM